jgi:hypothetical protein
MTDVLQKLFGSLARVKLLRLFLFNPKQSFSLAEAIERSQIKGKEARRELELFSKIKLIKRARKAARLMPRYVLNDGFEYVQPLRELLLNAPAQGDTILKRMQGVGGLKLLILSGVFVGEWNGSLDLLVVGERISERKLRQRVRRLESDLGKELRYASLNTQDFQYRLNMNDHLLRDMLDYPHRIMLDKLNIGLK